MDERMMQFRVGVMVLATLLITAILVVMFGKTSTTLGRYDVVKVKFDQAPGVTKGTPVRKSGILIGRVSDVEFVKDINLLNKGWRVIVTAEVQHDKPLYANERCRIERELVGDAYLTFVPDPREPITTELLSLKEPLPGKVSEDPTGLKRVLEDPINTVVNAGTALTEAAGKINGILDEETQKNIKQALTSASTSLQGLSSVLGDLETQEKLRDAVKQLPGTLGKMNNTFDQANASLKKFTDPSGPDRKTTIERMTNTIALAERTIARAEATLRQFTEPARPGQPAPTQQLFEAIKGMNEMIGKINAFTDNLNKGGGSLGLLVNDRELYDHLNRAAKNIDEVSRQLKPIVSDARAFTDKVSRHPGVIVRDAVHPGAGIK